MDGSRIGLVEILKGSQAHNRVRIELHLDYDAAQNLYLSISASSYCRNIAVRFSHLVILSWFGLLSQASLNHSEFTVTHPRRGISIVYSVVRNQDTWSLSYIRCSIIVQSENKVLRSMKQWQVRRFVYVFKSYVSFCVLYVPRCAKRLHNFPIAVPSHTTGSVTIVRYRIGKEPEQ